MDGRKSCILEYIFHEKPEFTTALPTAAQLACQLETEETYPQTIREGRSFVEKHLTHLRTVPRMPVGEKKAVMLHAQELWFRYEKHEEFVLRGANLTLCEGEIHALVGGNGSGKSTLLQLLAGVYPPAKGKIKKSADKRSAVLAQNPKALFLRDTVEEDLMEWASQFSYTKDEVREMMEHLGLSAVADRHPYDLSGGEMQKAALAKILLLKPDLLLLDEPAKGLDAGAKEQFQKILADLKNEGKAILLVTHDLELAAKIADRCSMMFRGEITCTSEGKSFFLDNVFYTTGVNRMTRGYLEGCVIKEDIAYVK